MQQTAVSSDNGTLALFPRTCMLISNYLGTDLKLLPPELISNYPRRFTGPTATSEAEADPPEPILSDRAAAAICRRRRPGSNTFPGTMDGCASGSLL
jgi:hypothetical protein